ncbi:uncharacterized protein LOC128953859 [Oppia nitens]|uniref:uncharacterized protein LOC128953859 n=1 Tax=Oppia nitens TaxID=1686743 RepID=UPI0023DCB954|nr:uncharacterized protein LOC128953859 [Oppia nitens]
MMSLNFAFSIIAILSCIHTAYGVDCNADGMRRFDQQVSQLISIANSGRKLPDNKGKDLKKWCDETDVIIKELEGYKQKCFKDLSKQVFGVLVYAVKNTLKQYCKRDSKKLDQLIAAVPCINTNDAIVTKCYTELVDGLLGSKNAIDTKKIPHLCCVYADVYDCFETKLTPAKKCNEKHVQTLSDLMRNIAGNVVNLICGDYVEGSDKCTQLGPAPKKRKTQKRTKSFALPLLDLLASFPEV